MKTTENKPKLTLVGAGPGDPDLLTLKGLKALQTADVVLYDALIDSDLLGYPPTRAEKIYVGKRAGKHSLTQTEINKLIVEKALGGAHVVRLKGGDPFVFGRGTEELEYAEAFGIETAYIPGISSSTALPGLNGIPLTQRGVSRSFTVTTATQKYGKLSKEITLAAQSEGTVVILMGLKKLKEITQIFSRYGKGETPVAIIQNGSLASETVHIGLVEDIFKSFTKNQVEGPGIIVIGEVVRSRPELQLITVEQQYFS